MRDTTHSAAVVIRQPLQLEDLSCLLEHQAQRYPHLLESVSQGPLGRFDILFAFPQETIQLNNLDDAESFKDQFEADFHQHKTPLAQLDIPFYGGWFGYFAYEYAQVIEPSLDLAQSELPLAVIQRFPAAILIDHQTREVCFVAEPNHTELLEKMQSDYYHLSHQSPLSKSRAVGVLQTVEEDEQNYLDGVETIKEYILAGDVFQVNLSRQWQLTLAPKVTSIDVYRQLCRHNPAPFAGLIQFDDWAIISSSPERLVRYQAPWVETRPIAGTRKRSDSEQEDLALIEELIAHPKERAEHIMLIDLERNDLGRICQAGSVEVNELMVVESYQHVHHIVSNVRGHCAPGLSPLKIIHALFPGGTITGCPKIRCMEIISELESGPRDAYTGSVGYINRDGSLDFNILIRSFIQQQDVLRFRAGAGIVTDSIASNELEEARHKAKGLLDALGVTS